MSSKSSFYLKAFLIALFSAFLFVGGFYLFLVAAFSNTSFMGGNSYEPTQKEQLLFYCSIGIILISLAISPLFAFFSLKQINLVTENGVKTSFLFTLICFLPVILLTIFLAILMLFGYYFRVMY